MPLGRLLAVARTGSLAVSFLLLLGAASAGDNAQARGLGRPAVEVTAAARHDASAPLWLLQRPDFTLEREEEEENDHRVHRFRKLPPAALRATGAPDAVLQSEMPWIRMPAVGVTFDGVGQGFTGPGGTFSVASAPPDTSGDVGPNHYIQVVNSGFAIFNKSGTTLFGPAPTNTLWSGFGGLCQTTNAGDAIVLYDALADRWFMTQFAFNTSGGGPVAPFFQCVAVSQTGDPTGAWYRYAYQYADFPDYGKFGVWPDGYYATFNMFAAGTLAWAGGNNCVYDRAAMLSGAPATQQCINLGTNYGGLLPADLDGTRLPPAGSPGYIMGFDVTPNSHLQLWHFRVSWANPAATTLTMQPTIPVATINLACGNGGTCVPQAGTANRLDTLGDRLMFRLAYRNFGTHDALVSNLTVNTAASSTANTGVRWFELRNPGTAPTLFQEGTYAPDANYRWMGSIAQDGQGNMGLGFSLSSSSLSPSIRYTGRLVTDPLGQMAQGENTIINGASQTGTLTRWGDYSMMGVDPTDDCTFWYTTEYLAAAGSFNWRTRVGSFQFPGCPGVANDFGLSASPRSAVLPVGASVTFTVTTSVKSGAAESISLSTSGLPAGVTASFSPATVTAGGSSTLTLTAPSGTSAANNVAFNIVGTSPSVSRMAVATVSVQRNEFTLAIAPSARTITAGSSGTYTVSTAVSSGSAESITLSISGLPTGVTASFSPATVTAGGASTLTLTVPMGASGANNQAFTVTGAAPSMSRTASATVTIPSDFSIALSPTSRTITSGTSTTYTVTTAVTSGGAETINLIAFNLPSGVSASFNPAQVSAGGTSTLTLTSATGTPGGTTHFTVQGSSPSATHNATAQLVVLNDFSLTVTPASRSVASGGTVTYTVTTARTSGTAQQVALSVSGLPSGVTATFSPATVNTGGASTLTVTAQSSAPGATATLTVTGTSPSTSRTATAQLTVRNDFSLALSPPSRSVTAGGSVTYAVATAVTSGSAEEVTLSLSGLPSGVTGTFSPATVSAGGTATLTLSADLSAAGGNTPFTVTGTAPSATRTANGAITVVNDFGLSVSPASQSVRSGESASYTVTTARASGDAEPITLSVDGLPPGVTATFSPATVTAGAASVLTLTAAQASVPGGTFAFTVTGSSASATHSAQASVTVRNDFELTVTPPSRVVNSGTTTTFTLATTVTSGDAEAVTLSVSGLPAGVTGVISPATVTAGGSATLTLTIDASTQGGTTAFTLGATSASASHSAQASLTIANDFALQVAPSSRSITSGGTATYTVTTTATSGTAETVTLSLSGLPSGITASFNPATVTAGGTATLTLTAAQASLPGGSFTLTVTGAAPSRTHTAEATVAVVNEFALAVTPSSRSISASTPGVYTIGTVATSGTPEEVTLSVAGLPAGVTGVFSPATVTAGDTATLTLTANAGTAGGTRTFTVTGTAASGSQSAEASATVVNDFSLSASPASQVILSGSGTSFTITTFTTSGSAEPVALSVSGLPSGVTAQFSPGTVPSGGTATLTLLADASVPGGTAVLTLTGTSPSATHTAQVGLTVANDFSLAVSPSVRSVRSGGSVSYTVTTARASGSPESIALGLTGLPSGLTARFDPAVVNAGGASTLTLTAANGTPGGTTPFSVTGTSASATRSAGGSVTVVNDFGLAVLPATAEVRGGGSVSYAVRTTVESGSAEPIVLSVSGLPAGITARLEPATVNAGGSATLTLSAVTGISTGGGFSVTGTSASATHAIQATVTVRNGFTLTTDSTGVRLTAGGTAVVNVTTSVTSGQAEPIALAVSGLPEGVTARFNPETVNAGGSATLTLTGAANLTAQPNRTLVVTGTSASANATADLGLVTLTAPTVAILTPAGGTTVSGTVPVTASAVVSAGTTPQKIELYVGDTLIGTSTGTASQFSVAWNTAPLANGPYDLRAKVYDADGNTAVSPTVPVVVRNRKPPTAAIGSPVEGATVRGTLTLEATASANGGAQLSKVEVYVDTILIGSSTTSPASFPWDSTLVPNGAHVVTAKAYDSEGEVFTSSAVNITVDNARCGCAADGGSLGLGGLLALLTVARRMGARRRREARA